MTAYKYLDRIKEDWDTNIPILEVTKFNNINIHNKVKIKKIVLDFSFKDINFDKKKMFSFLLILELITGQKAILTWNNKALLNIKKGTIVGCKVDLRGKKKFDFLDTLYLTLPKLESNNDLKMKTIKNNTSNNINFVLRNIFIFHMVELELNNFVKNLNISIITNSKKKLEKQFIASSCFINR